MGVAACNDLPDVLLMGHLVHVVQGELGEYGAQIESRRIVVVGKVRHHARSNSVFYTRNGRVILGRALERGKGFLLVDVLLNVFIAAHKVHELESGILVLCGN